MKFSWLGQNLHRPECVLCTSDGALLVSDWRGGICRIGPTGDQQLILAHNPPCPIKPNGFALLPGGEFLLANLGDDGGVWRMTTDGAIRPLLTELEGQAMPPANFVLVDAEGRIWITVSTRQRPRTTAYRAEVADGFIVRVDQRGAAVVADGLGYTNEIQFHPNGRWLYVNETFARRLSRFPVSDHGALGARETVLEFDRGIFPDGLAFDEAGGLWIISIVSNTVLRLDPTGELQQLWQDASADHLAWAEQAYAAGAMSADHLSRVDSQLLQNVSSIAFTGADRRTAVLGCLQGDRLATFPSPISGVMPVHWNWNITDPG